MNRIFRIQQTTFLIFHLRHKNNNDTVFKKTIKQPIIQQTPPETIPNIDLKTGDFFIDNDDFDLRRRLKSLN